MNSSCSPIIEYFLNGTKAHYNIVKKRHPDPSLRFLKDAFLTEPSVRASLSGWHQPVGAVYGENGSLVSESRMRTLQDLPAMVDPKHHRHRLSGKYVYMGYYNEVYGHFILETLARLWAIDVANLDERTCLFHSMHGNTRLNKSYIKDLLASCGIPESRIQIVDSDVVVEDLLVPSSLSYIGESQHEDIQQTFKSLYPDVKATPDCKAVYVSRAKVSAGNHRFINEEAIEDVFRSFGFSIVRPEEMSFQDQLAHYRATDILAGPLSSALHNSVFCKEGTTVIALNGRWNRARPETDIPDKKIDNRSVQDFLCLNYKQPLHYIEAQKAFSIEGHPSGRMPYWINEVYLTGLISTITGLPLPSGHEIPNKGMNLEASILLSLRDYASSKKMPSLAQFTSDLIFELSIGEVGIDNATLDISRTEVNELEILPNAQAPYNQEVERIRQKLNSYFQTSKLNVA